MRLHLLEEMYEVIDAIDKDDNLMLEEELGDALFNLLLAAQIAADEGRTDLARVAQRIHDKMVHRHPHVFAPAPGMAGPGLARWEELKAAESGGRSRSRMDGIPRAAPALLQAHRQGQKAAAVGFDWPDLAGVLEKVDEEMAELREAIAGGDAVRMSEELGDVLLSLASLGRHLKTPAEAALLGAVDRFGARFREMELAAERSGNALNDLDADALERLWVAAKQSTDVVDGSG